MNLKKLKCNDVFTEENQPLLIKFIKDFQCTGSLPWGDQKILNIFLHLDTKYEDPFKYNCSPLQGFPGGLGLNNHLIYKYLRDAYIIHYAGPHKPWKEDTQLNYIMRKPWLDIEKEYLEFLEQK